jgi:hypothetical protein
MHRAIAGTIVAIGLAAAPEAKAWIDLQFTRNTQYPVWLTCEANHKALCSGAGTLGDWIWWNPLDGNRYSKYTLWMDGRPVEMWMYDRRVGCSTGSGWARGWSWHVWLRPAKTGTWQFGPIEVCSGGGGGTERMKIHVYDATDGYQFEVRGDAPPGSRPGARFYFSPRSNVLQRVAF